MFLFGFRLQDLHTILCFLFGFRLQDLHTILYFFSGFGSKTFDRFRLKSEKTLHHHHQPQKLQNHLLRKIMLPHRSSRGTVRRSTCMTSPQAGHAMMGRVMGASVSLSVRFRNQQNTRRCLYKKKR